MKSPARVPTLHVPVGLIAPAGASVLTCSGACAATPLTRSRQPRLQSPSSAPRRSSSLRRAGLQRKRMQLAAHFGLQGFIDDLMLLHPRFTAERFGKHGGGVMVAVAGEVADRHLGIGNTQLDQAFDLARSHRHGSVSHSILPRSVTDSPRKTPQAQTVRALRRPYKPATSPRSARAVLRPEWGARLRASMRPRR